MNTPVLLAAHFVGRQALRFGVAETEGAHAVFEKTETQKHAPNRLRALQPQLLVVLVHAPVIAVPLDDDDEFRRLVNIS